MILQSRIFGLANSLKYQQDVLAALEGQRRRRRTPAPRTRFHARFSTPARSQDGVRRCDRRSGRGLRQRCRGQCRARRRAELDPEIERRELRVGASRICRRRARKPSDRDREPQFQERNWPNGSARACSTTSRSCRRSRRTCLTEGFKRALELTGDQAIPAVQRLADAWRRDGAAPTRGIARSRARRVGSTSAAGRKRAHGRAVRPRSSPPPIRRSCSRAISRRRSRSFARASGS